MPSEPMQDTQQLPDLDLRAICLAYLAWRQYQPDAFSTLNTPSRTKTHETQAHEQKEA